MRLSKLHIESFGLFHDLEISDISPNLVVLAGDNEAGKSTLLGFLRAVLFGFPRKNAAHDRVYPAIHGGSLGGRIGFSRGDGTSFEIERLAGRNGSRARVLWPDGQADDSAQIESLLGVDAQTFKTVFAFDLGDLVRLRDEREDIQAILYGAGAGTGHLALPQAEKKLSEYAKSLFTPKGRKASINTALKELSRVRSELVSARAGADRYEIAKQRLEEEIERIAICTQELKKLRGERRRLDRLAVAWPDAVELRDARERLAEVDPIVDTFPEDAALRWQKIRDEIERLENTLREKTADRAELLEELGALEVDSCLLDHADHVDRLVAEIEPGRRAYDRRQELRALLAEGDRAIQDELASLGPDFSLRWISDADPSLFARDEVRTIGQQLRDLEHDLTDIHERLEEKKRLRGAVTHGLSTHSEPASDELASTSNEESDSNYQRWQTEDELDRGRQELRQLAAHLRECDRQEILVSHLQGSRDASPPATSAMPLHSLWRRLATAGGILLGIGAIGATLCFFMGWIFAAWGLGGLVLVGLSLLVVGLVLRPAEPAPAPERSLEPIAEAEASLAEAKGRAARALRNLGSDAEPSWEQRDAVEQRLQAAADRLSRAKSRDERLSEIEGEIGPLQEQLDLRSEWLEEARKNWRRWVAARGFPRELSPESAVDALERIESLQKRLRAREDRQAEAAVLLEKRDNLYQMIEEVFELTGRPLPDRSAWVQAIEELDQSLRATREVRAQRMQQEKAVRKLEIKIEHDRSELQRLGSQRDELIGQAGAEDSEQFLRFSSQWQEVQSLRHKIEELRPRILRALEADNLAAAEAQLAAQSREDLDIGLDELVLREEELDQSLDRAKEARADLQRELDELASSEDIARLRSEEEALLSSIRNDAEDWARYTIAGHLLSEARAIYEREQQPRVLRTASRFFSTITDERYPELLSPLGEQEILVVDAAGRRKPSAELSRGTEEQLYLALRFGFIRQMGQEREQLPVIMDDIMVNFDPQRARNAARAIAELAEEQQVLYFTCHPDTVTNLRNETEDLVELRLADGIATKVG